MQIASYVLCYLCAFVNVFVLVKCYGKVCNKIVKINIFNLIVIFIASCLIFIVNILVNTKYKILFFYLIILFTYQIIFRENLYVTVYKTIVFYILLMFADFIASIFAMLIPVNIDKVYSINYIKSFSTILVTLSFIIIFYINSIYNKILKIFNMLKEKYSIYLVLSMFMFFAMFMVITYINANKFNYSTFFIILIVLLSFSILVLILVKEFYENKTILEKQKSLLAVMSEYESLLESDRINRHEMLNNLVVLKSYPNKTSKRYIELLDDMISEYQNKKYGTFSNLYKLPTGVKGIVYYKMANIIDKEIKFTTEIGLKVYKYFDKMDPKLYYKVSKIVGIFLDNAIEACEDTKEKLIFIEMFHAGDEITVIIENSTKEDIDFSEITKKGVSSKGKNRGYGLYIVKKIINSTPELILEQYIMNHNFVSELRIKINKKTIDDD